MPLGTLKDWLRPTADSPWSELLESQSKPLQIDPLLNFMQPQLATLFSAFETWQGEMSGFCDYARNELHLPFGRTFITNTLTAAGLYRPCVRRTPHQPPWSRGSLHAPFPGMQWFGDGKQRHLVFRGQKLTFNIEALVDRASNACDAVRVTHTEDAPAVVEAFHEGLQTSVVLDHDSGQLVERNTAYAYGAPESIYRSGVDPDFREDYRFTGKEDDIEVGLIYFGQRYYAPLLQRWLSPDPLAVHALGQADLNV